MTHSVDGKVTGKVCRRTVQDVRVDLVLLYGGSEILLIVHLDICRSSALLMISNVSQYSVRTNMALLRS